MSSSWDDFWHGTPEVQAQNLHEWDQAMRRVGEASKNLQAIDYLGPSESIRRIHPGLSARDVRYIEAAAADPSDLRGLGFLVYPREHSKGRVQSVMEGEGWRHEPTPAYRGAASGLDYMFNAGVRARDSVFAGIADMHGGDVMSGLGRMALAAPSIHFPQLASGRPGSDTDWRQHWRAGGGSALGELMLELGTDPEMYVNAPLKGPAKFIPLGLHAHSLMAAAKGARRMDAAIDAMRFGNRTEGVMDALRAGRRGIRTELVDPSGETLRRLINAERIPRRGLPYAQPN